MKTVADYEFIRRLAREHGMSGREIAEQFHFSRKTVRKALAWDGSEEACTYRRTRAPVSPKTGRYVAIIDSWLRADLAAPKKQRHTARRIWQRLRDEYGVDVAESTIRQLVAQRRQEIAPRPQQVFLMLTFQAGDLAQVDWGEAQVIIAGQRQKVFIFCLRLGYSTAAFVMAFTSMRMECFLAAHVAAFIYLGGVPRNIVYDYVPRNIIGVLCPNPLCGGARADSRYDAA